MPKAFVYRMKSGVIRQGITLAGIDVVVVAAPGKVDRVRQVTELAVEQYGSEILRQGHYPPVMGDRVLTAPIGDEATGELLGYVELAP